jgi:nicotinate-nucleotide--dimethylbenzimidazole phosphoribosyltransferase
MAERQRLKQAALLSEDARREMLDIQLSGIREAPLGIVVCCDRRVAAGGVIGRATYPDTDLWSCALAIENLWLAARAEGLGMGWVTLFDPDELAGLVDLPHGVATLGWLCLGWPDERLKEPGLERVGWSSRLELRDVVISEHWTGTGPEPPLSRIRAAEPSAVVAARDESDRMLTPPESLGVLSRSIERLVALGIDDSARATWVLVGADHGVARHRVSAFSSVVTREVLEASVAGESIGAAAAKVVGLDRIVVDAGVEGKPVVGALLCRVLGRRGDLVNNNALERPDVERFIAFGRDLGGSMLMTRIVSIGEVGIANTTVAAAFGSLLCDADPMALVGMGTGGDSTMIARKAEVVRSAVERARRISGSGSIEPLDAMALLGGPEFAVLTGIVLGVASRHGAIVLDGFATSLAALCAVRMEPGLATHLIAGQRSRERGHQIVLEELGLEAMLDLRLRAGEGVGAILATQLLMTGMKTRKGAGRTAS